MCSDVVFREKKPRTSQLCDISAEMEQELTRIESMNYLSRNLSGSYVFKLVKVAGYILEMGKVFWTRKRLASRHH